MANLIPLHAQKNVKREYRLRVAAVWAILLGTACAIVVVSSIPVYVLVRSQLEAFAHEYAQMSIESESYIASQKAITEANETAALLAKREHTRSFGNLIEEIETLSGPDVTITEFTLSQKGGTLEPIVINGIATSRLALTSFQERIKEHSLFKDADLPLSNLARDRDITFSITITPQEQE